MHNNKLVEISKATIISVIVALFIVFIILGSINILVGQKINTAFKLIDKITIIKNENANVELPVLQKEKKTLKHYPKYGSEYARIEISSIDVDLPVFFGDRLDILKKGVGHDSGSYFPGEGGSIIYMAHNFDGFFRRFGELKKGDKIKVTTNYGEFTYKIYDMQLINESDRDKAPIQRDEEILMVYTCYPFNNVGYTTQRYMVYSKLEKEVLY